MKKLCSLFLCALLVLQLLPAGTLAASEMTTSDQGVAFIAEFEGYRQYAYSDGGKWYIGYGTACGQNDYPDGVSEAEALGLLQEELAEKEVEVNEFLTKYGITLAQHQFDALMSLTYNLGTGWLNPSYRLGAYLIDGWDTHTTDEMVNAIATWCHVGTEPQEALAQRRLTEAYLFLYGEYENNGAQSYVYLHFIPGAGAEVPHSTLFYPINHAYGCGVAINAPEAKVPIRALRNLAKHPNFGGELMVVGLGCEKFTVEMLLDEADISPENVIILQEKKGFDAMIDALMEMADKKLARLNERKRQTLPLSSLLVGMQCGGSDAFSGVTANPSAGYAADMLVKGGATVMFSEVTEVRDGVYLLGERCVNEEVGRKLASEMKWYDHYLEMGQVDRSANPTPGNKKGGLSNIVEKAMGSIAKSGSSPIVEVLSPAEKPSKKGLIYAATPASDIVCGPCQLASGIGLQVFMTGRGTPYGLAIAPVIKVCSRNDMKEQWPDLIDVNAGPIATGDASIRDIGTLLFNEILDVASGRKQSFAEKYKLYNDLCIFNPAPIT